MIKHVFIAPIKEGVSEEKIDYRMAQMRALKEHVPELKSLVVEKALGWFDIKDAVVLIAELSNREDWEAFINNEYHKDLGKTDSEYFKVEEFICTQFEFDRS